MFEAFPKPSGSTKETRQEQFGANFVDEKIYTNNGEEMIFAKAETDENSMHRPVYFLGGFTYSKEAYYDELEDVFKSGRNILYANPIKGIEYARTDIEERIRRECSELKIPELMYHKVAEAIAIADANKIRNVDIVGTSQGALIASLIALLRPDIVHSLTLIVPAGLHGRDNVTRISASSVVGDLNQRKRLSKMDDEREKERMLHTREMMRKHQQLLTKDIFWRFIKEIPAIIGFDLLPVLRQLKERDIDTDQHKKIKINLILANKDITFNHKKVEEHLGVDIPEDEKDITDEDVQSYEKMFLRYIDSYAMYADKDAGHQAAVMEKPGILSQILNGN